MNIENEGPTECGCQGDEVIGHEELPQYCVNTEGTQHLWPRPTITIEEISELGGWPSTQGVIQVNEDNTERPLASGEVVTLEPGRAFCRKVRWKRGFTRADRITAEIDLMRRVFPTLEFRDGWARIAGVPMPAGWNRSETDVAFQISDTFPGAPPYGIYVPLGVRFRDQVPQNYTEPSQTTPPFGGQWGVFSWSVEDANDWHPCANVEKGVNLLQWVRGFDQRFREGV